ncbi:hypothetical protein GH714_019649 [Hevea brasiliensis]|uniref:S-locus receptor kinase C-terminal domain-containing protein n=1 Tax=Hevea brasiliensis TaxID=3981 RepID=A0A6A6LQ86_HEVBR|nr:hypothetical protein GH714_019649 [Hevea brasiliensis]
MEPKISDFGTAKLFGKDQIEANTKRVVGTYYGVLMLEIISGRKNTEYDEESPYLNLIGNVWELWREGKGLDIVDYSLLEHSYPCQEILRCIQIGLLCIQEHPADRPTMLEVVFMLGNETSLPSPKKPAFVFLNQSGPESLITRGDVCSINDVTVTMIEDPTKSIYDFQKSSIKGGFLVCIPVVSSLFKLNAALKIDEGDNIRSNRGFFMNENGREMLVVMRFLDWIIGRNLTRERNSWETRDWLATLSPTTSHFSFGFLQSPEGTLTRDFSSGALDFSYCPGRSF